MKINAFPTKSFFTKTLVKDIHLMDAILDLIDNSVDSYIKNRLTDRRTISIKFDAGQFIIEDNCGGIAKDKMHNHVFRFGEATTNHERTIGVYGIGLKRSIFKMGLNILIESDDNKDYFSVKIDKDWIENEGNWELDFEAEDKTRGPAMTKITIKELFPHISEELTNPYFQNKLVERIKNTYSIFIEERIDIEINDAKAAYHDFKFLYDTGKFEPFHKKTNIDGVEAEVYAGYTPRSDNGGNPFGWYVFCNDRLVVRNDTSVKTGWEEGERKYHYPEDNSFLGLAFLRSDNPLLLPWHTTKEDIQEDSKIYRTLQVEMIKITRRFIDVIRLAGRTKDPDTNETIGKSLFEGVPTKHRKEITDNLDGKIPTVSGRIDTARLPKTTSIQYSVEKKLLKAVKQQMGDSYMTNKEVGKKTYDYYVKMEELENE